LTNQEQAYHWLAEAERWNQKIDDAETRFTEAAKKGKITADVEVAYKVWSAAKDNFSYQNAVRQMKSAREKATMYAMFALLEKGAS
jgi:hypothetical protein